MSRRLERPALSVVQPESLSGFAQQEPPITNLIVGFYTAWGELVDTAEIVDPRLSFCEHYNKLQAEIGGPLEARPVVREGGAQ